MAVPRQPSCLWIQKGKWSEYAKASWKRQLFRALLWLAPTGGGERWERNKWNLMHVFSKQNRETDLQYAHQTYWIPKAISPALTSILHPLCSDRAKWVFTAELIQVIRLSIQDQSSPSRHSRQPYIQACQAAAQVTELIAEKTPTYLQTTTFSVLHPASIDKPDSWTVHSSSLCASGCT